MTDNPPSQISFQDLKRLVENLPSGDYKVVTDKWLENTKGKLQWSCPECGLQGARVLQEDYSTLKCTNHHFWWPSTKTLISSIDCSSNQVLYYGEDNLRILYQQKIKYFLDILNARWISKLQSAVRDDKIQTS